MMDVFMRRRKWVRNALKDLTDFIISAECASFYENLLFLLTYFELKAGFFTFLYFQNEGSFLLFFPLEMMQCLFYPKIQFEQMSLTPNVSKFIQTILKNRLF